MTATAHAPRDVTPDWLFTEMPPGYQTRLAEIQRLSADLKEMERFGQLLWRSGESLGQSAGDAFAALGFDVERPGDVGSPLVVKLPDRRRLLLHIAATTDTVQKKSPELTQIFRHLNETAESTDRVVLVVNTAPSLRPAERPPAVGADAAELLKRLGANAVTGPALFSLWRLSLDEKDRARALVERLHEQDGGVFDVPVPAR